MRKAVLPAAGLGTRFLPATKAQPKEMLPVVDKPAIQYVVEEAADAGLVDLLVVTGRNKTSLEDHFDRVPFLEQALADKHDDERLALVVAPAELGQMHYVRQGEPLGLGHAVLCAKAHVGREPFAVLLGDDLIDRRSEILPAMLDVQREHGGSVMCLMEVPPGDIGMYGCAAVEPTGREGVVRITELIEKPGPGEAPSNYAVIGRYVLDPAIFAELEQTKPGRGGEIQLTDAIRALIDADPADGGGVHGVIFTGLRYDTGDKLSYLKATVRLACARADLGPDFREWLAKFVAEEQLSDEPSVLNGTGAAE